MEIIISGKHTLVTQALEEYTRSKVEKLDKFFDGVTTARVVLKVEDNRKIAELVFSVARGSQIATAAEGPDMYAAIDQAAYRMREHLKKHKAKLRGRRDPTVKAMVAERESKRTVELAADEEEDEEGEGS